MQARRDLFSHSFADQFNKKRTHKTPSFVQDDEQMRKKREEFNNAYFRGLF